MAILKLSLVGIGGRLAILVVVLANTVLLARVLQPQVYGEYFIFLRVVSLLTIIADFGLSQSANAFAGGNVGWKPRIHSTLVRFVPAFWAVTLVLGAGMLWPARQALLPHLPRSLLVLAFAVLPMALYANFWSGLMIGLGRIWHLNLVRLTSSLVTLVLTLVFVLGLSGDVFMAAGVYSVSLLIQAIIMAVVALRLKAAGLSSTPPADLPRRMLGFGLRGYLSAVLYLVWTHVPVFALNIFYGPMAVGVFSVAQQLFDKILIPVQAMQDAVYGIMATSPPREAISVMNRHLRITIWGVLLASLVSAALAPRLILILAGEAYGGAGQVCRALFVGAVFMSTSALLDTYFINQLRRPGLVSIIALIYLVASLVLTSLLVPGLAEMGAAWALALTHVLGATITLALYLRMSRTRVSQVLCIRSKDLAGVSERVGGLLRWR